MLYCGIEQCDPGHRFGPNNRNSYVFHVILGGKGVLEINGDKYELEENDIFYIPWNHEAFYQADTEEPWKYMWIGVSGIMAKETIGEAGFSEKVVVRQLKEKNVGRIQTCIESMLEHYQLTYANDLRRLGELMKFFSILIEDYHESNALSDSHDYPITVYVNQAADYMKHHYNENIKINDIADYIGINRCYLSTSFKKAYGVSPKQYLNELRMKKAAALIKQGNTAVATVARKIGYDDALAFSKAFKNHYGVSPRQYYKSEQTIVRANYKGGYWNYDT